MGWSHQHFPDGRCRVWHWRQLPPYCAKVRRKGQWSHTQPISGEAKSMDGLALFVPSL